MPQQAVKCSIYRGGTSRGIFFNKRDLPSDEGAMKKIFYQAIDVYNFSQIDGLGAATSHTSKIVVVGTPTKVGADINYTFYQMGIGAEIADADGTCGNLMSAVGPFAINEGLVKVGIGETIKKIIIYDTNIDKVIEAYVPVVKERAQTSGGYQMKGVIRSGAKIRMDIVNPLLLVEIKEFGYVGNESLSILSADVTFMERLKYLRNQAVVKIGWAKDQQDAGVQSPVIPRLAIIAPAMDYTTTSGKQVQAQDVDIIAKLLSFNKLHRTFAASGLYCLAASCCLQGTLANKLSGIHSVVTAQTIRIGHPDGIVKVRVQVQDGDVQYVGMDRTARLIMRGEVYCAADILAGGYTNV